MSPRERSVFEAALRESRHSPAAFRALAKNYHDFTPAQREALTAVITYERDRFNQSRRRGNGKPESSHVERAALIGLDATRRLVQTREDRTRLVLPSIDVLIHDHPENFARDEGNEQLRRFEQELNARRLGENSSQRLSYDEIRERVARKKDDIKRTYLPTIRDRHVGAVWHDISVALHDTARRHNTSVDALVGTPNADAIGHRTLDLVTPFVKSGSVLANSYADRMRTALQEPRGLNQQEKAINQQAVLDFLYVKANDRSENTGTMYAATQELRRALAVERLERELSTLVNATPTRYRRKQEEYQTTVFAALDQAEARGLKTGDSFAQNVNDFKNIIFLNAGIRYLAANEHEYAADLKRLAHVTLSWEHLLKETVYHARQHWHSIIVHGIRTPKTSGHSKFDYQRLDPEQFSVQEKLARIDAFKRSEGWNRLDGDDGSSQFSEFEGILPTDHLAEQGGRKDSKGYAYNLERYFNHALYYSKKADDWLGYVRAYNSQLLEHLRTRGAVERPTLRSIPVLEGSLSSLAE